MSCNKIKLIFEVICIVITICIVAYWFVVYWRNEDVSKIEIKMLDKLKEIDPPELSICFWPPFIEDRLKDKKSNLNSTSYLKYLKGDIADDGVYSSINYEHVTINLIDYLEYVHFEFRGGNAGRNFLCNDAKDCNVEIRNSLNVFWDEGFVFYKCFGILIDKDISTQIRYMNLGFHSNLTLLLQNGLKAYINFNYPYQTLLMDEGDLIWQRQHKISWVKLKSVEVLRQRNTNNNPCMQMDQRFDELALERHIEKVGCGAPYQKSNKIVPLCDTMTKMRESIYDMLKAAKYHNLPCHMIAGTVFKTDYFEVENTTLDVEIARGLMVSYPDKIKIITQTQEVDFQALIGYIGGYIGLFLGIIFVTQIAYTLLWKNKLPDISPAI